MASCFSNRSCSSNTRALSARLTPTVGRSGVSLDAKSPIHSLTCSERFTGHPEVTRFWVAGGWATNHPRSDNGLDSFRSVIGAGTFRGFSPDAANCPSPNQRCATNQRCANRRINPLMNCNSGLWGYFVTHFFIAKKFNCGLESFNYCTVRRTVVRC